MSKTGPVDNPDDCLIVLLTGANSGLGYSICCRLIDDFVTTQPSVLSLHLIITTRDERKSNDTLKKLSGHLRQKSQALQSDVTKRVTFRSELLDLTSLQSVRALSSKLLETLPKLDVVLLNAGYGGLQGIDWLNASWTIPTDFPYAVTYPTFNMSGVGFTTQPQTSSPSSEPPLGTVFCSNIFGHYILVHQLAPLLSKAGGASTGCLEQRFGRIIWISSLEGYASTFTPSDIQGLSASSAYKASKRLTDILALTSSSSCNHQEVADLLGEASRSSSPARKMYVCHPGICATSFVPLPWVLYYLMTLVFYLARWVGSPWHTVSSYKGAIAPVWLTLAFQGELDALEADGQCKWGSCVTRGGKESVIRTEIEGWGVRGKVEKLDDRVMKGRRRGVTDVTEAEREDFEEVGKDCWRQMEVLRGEWERRMGWK